MWSEYKKKNALVYPYKKLHKIQPENQDELILNRDIPRLMGSIAKFGRMVEVDPTIAMGIDKVQLESLSFATRLCDDQLELRDVTYLVKRSSVDHANTTTIDLTKVQSWPASTDWKEEMGDISKYSEVVMFDLISKQKSVVFRMTVQHKKAAVELDIDGYFLGDVSREDVEPSRLTVRRLMYMFFPDLTGFQFNRRLHVPSAFCSDNAFLTYLFVIHLQNHGDYLQISEDYILRMKLDLPHTIDALELHDGFLGQLSLYDIDETSYPFLSSEYEGEDHLEVLEDMGWRSIDVEGDGNCGFYAFFLGLVNVGIKEFYVDTRRKRQKNMKESDEWIQNLYRFRKKMREHSEKLLTKIYPKEERDYAEIFWLAAQVFDDKQVEGYMDEKTKTYEPGLSEALAPSEISDPHVYVESTFSEDMVQYHMNVYWGPHVLASLYQLRVIVLFRTEDGPEEEEKEEEDADHEEEEEESSSEKIYIWSMMSFEYKNEEHSADAPHVEVIWHTDLETPAKLENARISDTEFNRVRTIEVLYMHKAKGGHFQFLRRMICTGIQSTPGQDSTTVREMVQGQKVIEGWSSSGVVQGETAVGLVENSASAKDNVELPTGTMHDNHNEIQITIAGQDSVPQQETINDSQDEVGQNCNEKQNDVHEDEIVVEEGDNVSEDEIDVSLGNAGGVGDVVQQENMVLENDSVSTSVTDAVINHATVAAEDNTRNDEEEKSVSSRVPHGVMHHEGSRRKQVRNVKTTKRVHSVIPSPMKKPRKNSQTAKKRRVELAKQTKSFNEMCNNGEIPATRMMYDTAKERYYTYNVVEKTSENKHVPIKRNEVAPESLQEYNAKLVTCARENPDRWVGPTVADANINTGNAPLELCTKQVCIYQQHDNPFCMVYSFASALWYCNLRDGAEWMHNAAPRLAEMDADQQINELLCLVKNVVPLIGEATVYGVRTNRHDRKKRILDWDTLFTNRTRYPTIVIPILPNGKCTHAFCVVDDLIFDSTTPCALKLCMDSVRWLFGECDPDIFRAYRFNKKYSPENNKVRGRYKHKMKKNW